MHPPQKANVQWYICKYIDELKRNERAWILQLTNDIPDTQARCLVFFCQRSPFLLNLHPWSQSWSSFPRIFPLLDWWSTIYPMLPILHLIQLALHDSPCGEPYWLCIRIIACLFFLRSLFPASSASHGVWMSIFFFQSLFCWIFVIFLWSLWEFGRFIYFSSDLFFCVGWSFRAMTLFDRTDPANWIITFSIFIPFFGCRSPIAGNFVPGFWSRSPDPRICHSQWALCTHHWQRIDPLYSSVLEHMLRIVPAVLY